MIQRCYNKNNKQYPKYGNKNIKVCDEWRNNFQKFLDDMGFKPSPIHILGILDKNKWYSIDNCRWMTRKEESQMHRSKLLEFNGDVKTILEWSKYTGIPVNTLKVRLFTGWSVEKTLTTPVIKRN